MSIFKVVQFIHEQTAMGQDITHIKIRLSQPNDARQMTVLAKRSKAYWGYKRALIKLWQEQLTVTEEFLQKAVGVVAHLDKKMIGFWVRECKQSTDVTDGFLFIAPEHIGSGCGRLMYDALKKEMYKKGIHSFVVEADPNAAGFYLKMGGKQIGQKESELIPGRFLPLIQFEF